MTKEDARIYEKLGITYVEVDKLMSELKRYFGGKILMTGDAYLDLDDVHYNGTVYHMVNRQFSVSLQDGKCNKNKKGMVGMQIRCMESDSSDLDKLEKILNEKFGITRYTE